MVSVEYVTLYPVNAVPIMVPDASLTAIDPVALPLALVTNFLLARDIPDPLNENVLHSKLDELNALT